MAHTPGPWHYQEHSDAYTHIVRDEHGKYICGCSQDSGDAEANGRLIAVAPELLDALKEIVSYLDEDVEFFDRLTTLIEKAQRAATPEQRETNTIQEKKT